MAVLADAVATACVTTLRVLCSKNSSSVYAARVDTKTLCKAPSWCFYFRVQPSKISSRTNRPTTTLSLSLSLSASPSFTHSSPQPSRNKNNENLHVLRASSHGVTKHRSQAVTAELLTESRVLLPIRCVSFSTSNLLTSLHYVLFTQVSYYPVIFYLSSTPTLTATTINCSWLPLLFIPTSASPAFIVLFLISTYLFHRPW